MGYVNQVNQVNLVSYLEMDWLKNEMMSDHPEPRERGSTFNR